MRGFAWNGKCTEEIYPRRNFIRWQISESIVEDSQNALYRHIEGYEDISRASNDILTQKTTQQASAVRVTRPETRLTVYRAPYICVKSDTFNK